MGIRATNVDRLSPLWALLLLAVLLACRPGRSGSRKKIKRKTYDAIQVAANAKHTCLLRKDGTARCFGADDTRNPPMTPTPKDPLVRIETGRRFACGIRRADKALVCWGDCSAAGRCTVPAGAFEDVALADDSGGCAWSKAGAPQVACWGGWQTRFPPPAELATTALKQLVISVNWAAALRADGTLMTWGSGAVVSDPRLRRAVAAGDKFRLIGGRGALLCLVDTGGAQSCIVHHGNQQPPTVSGRVLVIDAASPRGAIPACILVEDGGSRSLRCSRTNKRHQLPAIRGQITDMVVGDDHVCALFSGGKVKCVGDDMFGRVTGRSLFKDASWP